MSIILKENEWAKDAISSRSLGKKPSETLRRVARYYLDQNYSKKEVRQKLDIFLLQCDPSASLPKWSDSLDFALSRAAKYPAVDIDYIKITNKEMAVIDSLDGRQLKRLAFTLLCLAKYWKIVMPNNEYWVSNKDNEIMSLANINTSIKRQGAMYKELGDRGLIKFSKKVDNTSVKVDFVQDGRTALKVTDFRNLGYQYLMCHGESYIKCENCGITTKFNAVAGNSRQKYCPECAASIKIQQKVEAVIRHRTGGKSENVVLSDMQ